MMRFLTILLTILLSAAAIAALAGCPAQPEGESEGVRVITSEGGETVDGEVTRPAEGGDGAASGETGEEQPAGDSTDAAEGDGEPDGVADEPDTGQDDPEAGGADSGSAADTPVDNGGGGSQSAGGKSPFPAEGELWGYDDLGKNQNEKVQVLIETDKGNIMFELYPEIAPKTVSKFVDYVNSGFYKDTYFYRVEKGFVTQGGNPLTSTEIEKVGYGVSSWPDSAADKKRAAERIGNVPDEKNYARCDVGTISLAKLVEAGYGEDGKAGYKPGSAAYEFFINTANNSHLNDYFTVFGKVVAGMDVVQRLTKDDVIRNMRVVQ